MREAVTSVPTAMGELRALVRCPDEDGASLPGVVLVDGAGEGTAEDWGEYPERLVSFGAVVLSHDKPGGGGSPGDWREQTLEDLAGETLAAVEVLRAQPSVDASCVSLLGVSQGGWVSLIAASLAPEAISRVVTVSGPACPRLSKSATGSCDPSMAILRQWPGWTSGPSGFQLERIRSRSLTASSPMPNDPGTRR